jgi:hypothetical protein
MDVTKLRSLLMEIGNRQFHQINDEIRVVGTSNSVKPLFQRITDVIGVWLATDYDKTGTNYATGGGFDEETIFLGTPLTAGKEVVITYVVADGLNDTTAQTVINWAKIEVLTELQDFTINLDAPSTNFELAASVYWDMLSMANAYLLLNNVNFVQSDANISLFNYQTMSKLWGEGMSTDALFGRLFMRIDQIRKSLFLLQTEGVSYISEAQSPYWKDQSMFSDWLDLRSSGDAIDLYEFIFLN